MMHQPLWRWGVAQAALSQFLSVRDPKANPRGGGFEDIPTSIEALRSDVD